MTSIPYTSQLFEEDGQIVALCPELNVSSFGDTPAEALASLQEAVMTPRVVGRKVHRSSRTPPTPITFCTHGPGDRGSGVGFSKR